MIAHKPPVTKAFLDSFDDAGVFNCGDFNLVKVAQDAILREVGKANHHTYFDKPPFLVKLWFRFKQGSRKKIEISSIKDSPRLLAVVPPRSLVSGGKEKNQYLGNIFEVIPRSKMHLLYLPGKECPAISPEITHQQVIYHFEYETLEPWEFQFLKDLNSCLKRIKKETSLNRENLRHVLVGFDEFWRKYRAFRKYFSNYQFNEAILIPGYYTEHIIAALKSFNVKVIELQHGVITTASHFYCYPEKIKPVARKAFFADQVWLFGNYWKKELLKGYEFEEGQIHIIGDYFVRSASPPADLLSLEAFEDKFKFRVLVGTQTKRHQAFNVLIRKLSEKYLQHRPEVGILVKRHPAESADLYSDVVHLPNVFLAESNLDFLYPRCHAYISMYSYTLFEACRIPQLKKFVLESPETIDFVNGIVATGVAVRLKPDEDPLELKSETDEVIPENLFTPDVNYSLLNQLKRSLKIN